MMGRPCKGACVGVRVAVGVLVMVFVRVGVLVRVAVLVRVGVGVGEFPLFGVPRIGSPLASSPFIVTPLLVIQAASLSGRVPILSMVLVVFPAGHTPAFALAVSIMTFKL